MIKIEEIEVFGWKAAIRGMRNPKNSWAKSDTIFNVHNSTGFVIGENDMKLMKQLVKAGSDHRKFLRFINVSMDVTAPFYWWKEFDTYKVGTVANSCSTMHKIHEKEFTLDDFSHEHLTGVKEEPIKLIFDSENPPEPFNSSAMGCLEIMVAILNHFRKKFIELKDKKYWWQMIQLLPTSFNQKRTIQLNYEVLLNQYHARKDHKLDEWREFCDWIETLPYFEEICLGE